MTTTTLGRETRVPEHGPDAAFTTEHAHDWYGKLIADGIWTPGPVVVPTADMADTAAFLAGRGFRVTLLDEDKDRVRAAKETVKSAGASLNATFDKSILRVKPWHLGPMSHAVDHTLLAQLPREDRFGYVNRMARLVPSGGLLVGVFRIGDDERETPPRSIRMANFRKMLFRYFVPETWELAATPEPGRDQAWRGLLRRK